VLDRVGTVAAVGDEHRRRVAVACRILAAAGLIEDVLGHVSVRLRSSDADVFRARRIALELEESLEPRPPAAWERALAQE